MEDQDKIFEQFKIAAENSETNDFPGLERVWSRVDAKLATQVHKTQSKTNSGWKKFAVAASVVVGTALAYQFLKTDKPVQPSNTVIIVASDSITQQPQETVAASADSNATTIVNEKEAKRILEKQINTLNQVAIAEPAKNNLHKDTISILRPAMKVAEEVIVEKDSENEMKANVYEAISVKHKNQSKPEADSKKQLSKKAPPLIIVDGKVVKNDDEVNDSETILELEEPLYIINGVEYSEKEMFGPNPTSPYFPLNKQDIESATVYEGKEATEKFGQKGAKGVVVIKTKNGKPKASK